MWHYMIEEEIRKLREELNKSIVSGQDYKITYDISIKLDDLIAEYYSKALKRQKKKKKTYSIFSFV